MLATHAPPHFAKPNGEVAGPQGQTEGCRRTSDGLRPRHPSTTRFAGGPPPHLCFAKMGRIFP